MKNLIAVMLICSLLLSSCNKPNGVVNSQSLANAKASLAAIAAADSPNRIIKDAQGNIIELDLVGLGLSDQFVKSLLAPELASLQKFSVSGEMITDQTMTRLLDNDPYPHFREIVFEDTGIVEDHPWVKQYRESHSTKLTFRTHGSK